MIKDEYPLGFRLALHRKDLGIALDLAEDHEVGLPLTGLTATLEDRLIAAGHGDEDMSVLANLIRHIRAFELRSPSSATIAPGPSKGGIELAIDVPRAPLAGPSGSSDPDSGPV